MTDNTFDAAPDATDEASNRRVPVLVGGVLGVAVLAGAGFFLLHGGSSSDASLNAPVARGVPAGTVGTTPVKTTLNSHVPTTVKLPTASAVKIGRDPFLALYVVPAAVVATVPTTGTGTTGTTAPTGTTGTGTTGTPAAPVATTYQLKLLKVTGTGSGRTAAFSVAGKTQYARIGSVFGRSSEIKLLSFQQSARGVWSVTVQVGDDDPKDLIVNEVISVL
jgi:hypothetical protein